MISQILKVTVLNQDSDYEPVADNESVEDNESAADNRICCKIMNLSQDNESVENNDTTNWDNYEHYDELRQDIDGYWYTRRQFYDYYGSDEAWDQLDPDVYQIKRYDSTNEEWYTRDILS